MSVLGRFKPIKLCLKFMRFTYDTGVMHCLSVSLAQIIILERIDLLHFSILYNLHHRMEV